MGFSVQHYGFNSHVHLQTVIGDLTVGCRGLDIDIRTEVGGHEGRRVDRRQREE